MPTLTKKIFLLIVFMLYPCYIYADMGAFAPNADVDLREPGQKAVIAYDGAEEILILGTDMESSRNEKVLRFIPLPNKPDVQLAEESMERMASLAKSKKLRYYIKMKSIGGTKGIEKPIAPEIVFHQRLGAHDLTVVKVRNPEDFTSWINGFLSGKGLPSRPLSQKESEVVEDYLRRGFFYFVFDLVELDDQTRTVDPILYRFKTTHFYYPLITSNLFGHRGRIELFVFMESRLDHLMLRRDGIFKFSQPSKAPPWTAISNTVAVEDTEIQSVSKPISDLLGKNAYLTAYLYEGLLKFENDLWLSAPETSIFPMRIRRQKQ